MSIDWPQPYHFRMHIETDAVRLHWEVPLVGSRLTRAINGTDLGQAGPVAEQAHLSDFWVPQRGLFAFADAFFEAKDLSRHLGASCRSSPDP